MRSVSGHPLPRKGGSVFMGTHAENVSTGNLGDIPSTTSDSQTHEEGAADKVSHVSHLSQQDEDVLLDFGSFW